MIVLGLTGGVGMGKSSSARFLEERGIRVIDTDVIARELVEPGQPAVAEIRAAFGPGIISVDGRLRREVLAARVFSDPIQRGRLEGILHPRIRQKWVSQLDQFAAAGAPEVAVVIPLLFETRAESRFDYILCAACSAETQKKRLAERGWSELQIRQRLESQWPIEKKIELSDFVIWTEGSLDVHAKQIERILGEVRPRQASPEHSRS